MEILAKKLKINENKFVTQSLQKHTEWVIEEALKLIDDKSLDKVAKYSGFEKTKIIDLVFFSAYFHDIGKDTKEFQSTITNGTKSYHSLYSASVLVNIEDFEFKENDIYINLLMIIVLTHHSLLSYTVVNENFTYLEDAEDFFNGYKNNYKKYLGKKCKYNFNFNVYNDIKVEVDGIEDELKCINNNNKLRILYSYVSGILNLADWLASARFSKTKPHITFNVMPTKYYFCKNLTFDKLREFQKELSSLGKSVLVEIPTGEGKTEGSLLWAIKNLYNEYSKIIYTLPTQITSNKLYERVQVFFNKKECGLIHSSAKIYLEKKYSKENGEIDDVFKSDFLLSKSFNKPITISTIDSLFKYFINIGRFNIATKNFLNSVIIIDEIHSYDFKLMGFMKRFLELCEELDVKVCLMSASIPIQIKKLLGINNYPLISQEELFKKKANEIIKSEGILEDSLSLILEKFKLGKKVLVIRNTVKSATQIFKDLKDIGVDNIILYHSTFKKRDKATKENQIFKQLESNKPFILVATQIVEVSLDIDFDVMFTDNAPIDSLIQRFGRVNRKKSISKKGTIYIYQTKSAIPYKNELLLELTYQTIKNGYFELAEYVKWLNIVYDKLFEDNLQLKNEISRLFDNGYNKYDDTLKKLYGIEKSSDNYDLRDIEESKNDYLLYDDYMNEKIDNKDYYEYTIALPYWLEKKNLHVLSGEEENKIFYKVLKLNYSLDEGIQLTEKKDLDFW